MAAYVAMEPADADAERTVLVRDAFTFLAFLVPAPWFLWHRMWIEALLALGLMLGLGALDTLGGTGGPAASLLVSLLIGLEAPSLRLWSLRRRGWREQGVVEAQGLADAETRLFLGREDEAPAPPVPRYGQAAGPVLGLLDRRSIA